MRETPKKKLMKKKEELISPSSNNNKERENSPQRNLTPKRSSIRNKEKTPTKKSPKRNQKSPSRSPTRSNDTSNKRVSLLDLVNEGLLSLGDRLKYVSETCTVMRDAWLEYNGDSTPSIETWFDNIRKRKPRTFIKKIDPEDWKNIFVIRKSKKGTNLSLDALRHSFLYGETPLTLDSSGGSFSKSISEASSYKNSRVKRNKEKEETPVDSSDELPDPHLSNSPEFGEMSDESYSGNTRKRKLDSQSENSEKDDKKLKTQANPIIKNIVNNKNKNNEKENSVREKVLEIKQTATPESIPLKSTSSTTKTSLTNWQIPITQSLSVGIQQEEPNEIKKSMSSSETSVTQLPDSYEGVLNDDHNNSIEVMESAKEKEILNEANKYLEWSKNKKNKNKGESSQKEKDPKDKGSKRKELELQNEDIITVQEKKQLRDIDVNEYLRERKKLKTPNKKDLKNNNLLPSEQQNTTSSSNKKTNKENNLSLRTSSLLVDPNLTQNEEIEAHYSFPDVGYDNDGNNDEIAEIPSSINESEKSSQKEKPSQKEKHSQKEDNFSVPQKVSQRPREKEKEKEIPQKNKTTPPKEKDIAPPKEISQKIVTPPKKDQTPPKEKIVTPPKEKLITPPKEKLITPPKQKEISQRNVTPPNRDRTPPETNRELLKSFNKVDKIYEEDNQDIEENENRNKNNNNNNNNLHQKTSNNNNNKIENKINEDKNEKIILCSGLKSEELKQTKLLCVKLGGRLVKQWSDEVTHLVTNVDPETKTTKRTVKYLLSILSGNWVVSFDWVENCLSQQKWSSESKFEVKGDNFGEAGTPTKSRMKIRSANIQRRLFQGKKFYFYGEFKAPSKDELELLIQVGHGKVLEDIPKKPQSIKQLSKLDDDYLICDPSFNEKSFSELYKQTGRDPINFQFILDCISKYEILDKKPYYLDLSSNLDAPTLATQHSLDY
eukprot:TRINITY_DN2656_c0_g1_i1.p1 TRINITY_DN2656_c0_g1~~TRINITY_DN2656_c0_g1_i1.p1  ORF type:complete len:1030 (+),score=414.49 TRINITY_DN2656_c0_g1_i1:260-3091(+)